MKINFKKKLSKREKYSIYAALGVIALFMIIQFIVSPVIDKKKRLLRSLDVKAKTFREMVVLKEEYDSIDKQANLSNFNLSKREKGFTLFSFLDKLSGQAGIKDRIEYMKPSSNPSEDGSYKLSQVELKIQAINLKQLTSYLHMIETSENIVFIKRISISQTVKPEGFIEVIMLVETIET